MLGSCWMYFDSLVEIIGRSSSGAHGFVLQGLKSCGLSPGHIESSRPTLWSCAIVCLHKTVRFLYPLPQALEQRDQSPTSQRAGQSRTLQYCRSGGAGCGLGKENVCVKEVKPIKNLFDTHHMLFGTIIVFSPPRVTSWMQLISLVLIPMPHDLVQGE